VQTLFFQQNFLLLCKKELRCVFFSLKILSDMKTEVVEENFSEASPFGGMRWFEIESGWNRFKIARLARAGRIPGARQAVRHVQGSAWEFRKDKARKWLRSLEAR
jgi:hypothetical protein